MIDEGGDAWRLAKVGSGQEIPAARKVVDRRQHLHQRLLSVSKVVGNGAMPMPAFTADNVPSMLLLRLTMRALGTALGSHFATR